MDGGLASWGDGEDVVIPFWYSYAEAEACRAARFIGYDPLRIRLQYVLEEILPGLDDLDAWIALHPTPALAGNQRPAGEFMTLLKHGLQ